MSRKFLRRIHGWTLLAGICTGILVLAGFNRVMHATSSDAYCQKCHFHPHSTETWKLSVHYRTASGTLVHCVDCHLPPKGEGYLFAKVSTGARDIYASIFKDSASMNWELKSRPEHAVKYAKDISCMHCHQNLYPLDLERDGMDAHFYYEQQDGAVSCIKCHIDAGHYHEGLVHESNVHFGKGESHPDTVYIVPAKVSSFEDFSETIPFSSVSFRMKAIPGGTFTMGAGVGDKFAAADEMPAREVELDSFFMAETEVSWDEYLAWYSQTSAEGRTTDIGILDGIDAISGATPPYGNPDQGWGKGKRPAITMTFYAAVKYCEWLSEVTGKRYRLPTEAEWEYAARGGMNSTYFFEGEVKDYSGTGVKAKLFGADTTLINSYVAYEENSGGRTLLPEDVQSNPFGLKHMLGNVAEFCMDIYREDAYSANPGPVRNPLVAGEGGEHVIRGGSYLSNATELRISDRSRTSHDAWLRTDPQVPKSLWWYSDCNHVGFRVLCEYTSTIN